MAQKKKQYSMPPQKNKSKNLALFLTISLIVFFAFYLMNNGQGKPAKELSYTTFMSMVKEGKIKEATIVENDISGHTIKGDIFHCYIPYQDANLMETLINNKVKIIGKPKKVMNPFMASLLQIIPWILILGLFWFFMLRQMQGAGNKAMSFGKSRARLHSKDKNKITFDDVAGEDEAKQELAEVVEFLKEPKKFIDIGARIPKGALLVGPPGTGKTLLAKAVAGEADVPFFSISGSDFVEMFVGVGASRVRDLFAQGKKNAPCILFIDEMDAVGRHRGAGLGGGHDEREQTLNQLLVEMDGFEANEGIILLAATNRPDVLDPALLRPGRFDRQIVVDIPDIKGRLGILQVHTKKVKLDKSVDLNILARGTPGFSGADLENLVNEAALLAARNSRKTVVMSDFEEAKDKVLMGPARKSMILKDDEKAITAWHEAGHTLLGMILPHSDPIHKVTIIPRGRALGVTQSLPETDRHSFRKSYYLDQLVILFGGRAAEALKFIDVTSGASNDIQRATDLARKMICEWGMSTKLGPIYYGTNHQEIFLGKEISEDKKYGEATEQIIDSEVRLLVSNAYKKALVLLKDNMKKLETLANALIEKETLSLEEINKVIKVRKINEKSKKYALNL